MAKTNKTACNIQRNKERYLAHCQDVACELWLSRPFGFRLGVALLLVTRDSKRARYACYAALFAALGSMAYAASVTVCLVWGFMGV